MWHDTGDTGMSNDLYVLGSSGCLGSAVMRELSDLRPRVILRSELNLLSQNSISKWVEEHSPCTVINCAVVHNWFDDHIYDVNVFGPFAIASEMAGPSYDNVGNRFIHISSDYVGNVRPTAQTDILSLCAPAIKPLGFLGDDDYRDVYSRSKYLAEAILASVPVFDKMFRLYVIRVGGLFGKERSKGKFGSSLVERIVYLRREPPEEDVVLFNKQGLLVSFADFVSGGCFRAAVTRPSHHDNFWYNVAQCGYITSTSSLVEEIVGIMYEDDYIPDSVSGADQIVI